MMNTGTGCDMLCCYCGRPVIGQMTWGATGPYHPECCQGLPPIINHTDGWGEANRALTEIYRRLGEIELLMARERGRKV